MRTIGLLGGMSWASSAEYYRIINESVMERLGGNHSARCIMYSVDFAEVEELQDAGRWQEAASLLIDAARRVEGAGADFLVLCTNTMHKLAGEIERSIGIPLLHIADAAATEIRKRDFDRIGLLGTAYTMEEAFYRERLREKHHIEVMIPDEAERRAVHRIIYEELVKGRILSPSREVYRRIIASLTARGAQALLLACTEIGLLVGSEDSRVPLFDTARIHALAAVELALSGEGSISERR